ncbi:PD-(D/E)XK motif protein [Streptacidiphilus jiangxiensis]|uniref:Putative PD-(D/E)XK family member n=1 Tax=Streptacidiphilus jiangxiensis TaxID=235985 RepID=A0A1H7RFT0_STRJI|nr:PD-(D/E)XK motif protein [Streptacidiphilus jiangxiensis]SEL59022.1 Putative PD-(D/E)XK family member [Streptacidiphilus jiangxiensis]
MTSPSAAQISALFGDLDAGTPAEPGSVRRRLPSAVSLDVFAEVRYPEREWALLIDSAETLQDRDLVLANGLTCSIQSGNVQVVAQPSTDRGVFSALLADLLAHLASTSAAPATAVTRRLTTWQRMLGRGLGQVLGSEERAGLFGELLLFRDFVVPAAPASAVSTWSGPRGGAKDFLWGDWGLEAKTTVSSQRFPRCRIHGEEQLSTASLGSLLLAHQTLRRDSTGLGLPDLVDELRAHRALADQLAELEEALLEAGWVESHRRHYEDERWVLANRRFYRVEDGFPRVISTMLPPGISGISYNLDLRLCGPFQVDDETVRETLRGGASRLGEEHLVRE